MPRHKSVITATISPYTKRKLDMLVNSGLFASGSDVVDKAIVEFFTTNKEVMATGGWG